MPVVQWWRRSSVAQGLLLTAAACGDSTGSLDADTPYVDSGTDTGPLDCRTTLPAARSVTPTPSCERDAYVHYNSICERCEADGFGVIVQVGNRGTLAIAAGTLRIEVFGEGEDETRMLTTRAVDEAIASGEVREGVAIAIEGEPLDELESIGIRVSGLMDDCQPGNDALGLIGPFCEPHLD